MSEMLMVEQRRGRRDSAPWIVEGGRVLPGVDDQRRMGELRSGLLCHLSVRTDLADAGTGRVRETLVRVHDAAYLETLWELDSDELVTIPELAAPGLPPDIPVSAGLVAAAEEGVRTAITAALRLREGARFAYALSRPPGHHAGPDWFAGYCYLNSAAAAALTLRDGGLGPVGILDLDLHYPNGTAAIAARLREVRLHSLHAWPVTNVAAGTVRASGGRERAVEFRRAPSAAEWLEEIATSVGALAAECGSLVLSLGYDTVAGDPHGSWAFPPETFARVGRLLADARLPVCVVQEGGYALDLLAACAYAFASGLLDRAAEMESA
jgi:acetoin utilization deacetylase AcuC-like enzyme